MLANLLILVVRVRWFLGKLVAILHAELISGSLIILNVAGQVIRPNSSCQIDERYASAALWFDMLFHSKYQAVHSFRFLNLKTAVMAPSMNVAM